MLALWNGIAFWSAPNANTPPPPTPLLLPLPVSSTVSFSSLVFQLQTRTASEEDPECDITREPPHNAPLGPRPHVPWHDATHRYGSVLVRSATAVARALILSVWVPAIAFFYCHAHAQPPHEWPPRSLSSKWQPVRSDTCTQPPDTSRSLVYQKQIFCSTPGNEEGENKLERRSFLSDYSSRCCILPWVHSN